MKKNSSSKSATPRIPKFIGSRSKTVACLAYMTAFDLKADLETAGLVAPVDEARLDHAARVYLQLAQLVAMSPNSHNFGAEVRDLIKPLFRRALHQAA